MRWNACGRACRAETTRAFLSRCLRGCRISVPAGDEHLSISEDVMNMRFPRLGAFAVAATVQIGLAGLALAQGAPPAPGAGGQPGYAAGAGGQMVESSPSTETTPGTELPVLYVTSIEVMRTATEPKLDIVRVTGLTGSQGWSAPQLVPTFVGKPSDGILDLQFIATMRQQTESAEGFVPIGAVFPL